MTKQELERQVEKLNNRIRLLEQNNTELAVQNRIMKNTVQAMLVSIDGKQINILEPQFNRSSELYALEELRKGGKNKK